jgi:hypothetical protein
MIQNGTSQSPFCNRFSTTYYAPDVLVTSSTLQLRFARYSYVLAPIYDAVFGCLLHIPSGTHARRVYGAASQLPGTSRLRFTLHGGQRMMGCIPVWDIHAAFDKKIYLLIKSGSWFGKLQFQTSRKK